MAVYYYNGSKILAPLTITSEQPMFETTSVSLKTQRANQGAQRWVVSFTTLETSETLATSFISLVTGLDDVQTFTMPQIVATEIAGAAPQSAAITKGASTFTITNNGAVTGTFKKGEFIQFASHDKVYVVTQDANASQVIRVFPDLVKDVPINTNVNVNSNVQFAHLRSLDTATGITFSDGILSSPGTITLIEAI